MLDGGHTVSTRMKGWENQCRRWARSKARFEVRDIEVEHFGFCQDLCTRFQYEYAYKFGDLRGDSIAYFVPEHRRITDVGEVRQLANV